MQEHRPAAQAPVALAGAHARPQAPQLARSLRVSTSQPLVSLPSQSEKPVTHDDTQVPSRQPGNELVRRGHARPHIPQCEVLALVSTSQPFTAVMSQSAKVPTHAATAQRPMRHAGVALGSAQATPHAPQRITSLWRSASQPLAGFMSQSAKPAAQSYSQRPAAHRAVALGRVAQAIPQPPQWAALVKVLVSQPLPAELSQSP